MNETLRPSGSAIWLNKVRTFFSKPYNVILLLLGILLTITTVAPIIAILQDTVAIHPGTVDAKLTGQTSGWSFANFVDLFTNKIVFKKQLSADVFEMAFEAPHIAREHRAGQFLIVQVDHDRGERIPLTIADADPQAGTITIVYLVMGKSTAVLESLNAGDSILDVCGPLGHATHIEKRGTVICVGGGTGIAAMHHIAKGLKSW